MMNIQLFKILVVTLGIFSFLFPQDFWQQLPAPTTSYTYSSTNRILITPSDDIYIVAEDGIYKSTDGGLNWNSLIIAGEPFYVSKTGDIYVGGGFGGMVLSRSSDGGLTWDSLPVPYRYGFYSVLETADGSILVGLDHADAILKNGDGGSSFSLVFGDTSYSFGVWNSLLQDSTGKIYAMQDYQFEIYTSVDNGDTWDTSPIPVGTGRLKGYYVSRSGVVYYSTETGFVLTLDNGALVEHARVGLPQYVGSVVCVRDDGLLLVSNTDVIVVSSDNGATWSLMNMSGMDTTSVFANIGILDMEVDSRGYVYVYGPRGLYKSTTGFGNVSMINQNNISLEINSNLLGNAVEITFAYSKNGILKIMNIGGTTLNSYDVSRKTKIFWNGIKDDGRILPAGIYFIEAHLDGKEISSRLILTR